jgi:Lrp/AsnC family leucine-responsive transcriptional regulator
MAKAIKTLPPPSPKIDELDLRILRELDQDASLSLSQIGKRVSAARDVVHYRVKRLERSGVIQRYIALFDHFKLGYFSGEISLKLRGDSPALREEIINTLNSNERVAWVSSRDGKYDLMVGWYARSIPEADELHRNILKDFPRHVASKQLRVYSRRFMFRGGFLYSDTPKQPGHVMMEAKPQRLTDETDEAILRILSSDARAGYTEIGRELKLSAAQVQLKITSMKENEILLGSRPLLDLTKLGYRRWRLNFYLSDYSEYESLLKYAANHPNSVRGHEVLGTPDISIEFEVKGYEHMKEIEDGFKKMFGEAISYIETTRFSRLHKGPSLSPV